MDERNLCNSPRYYLLYFLLTLSFPIVSQSINESLNYTVLFNGNTDTTVSCYRIPAIITAKNGDLIVAIDERVPSCGDLKWSDDINIVIRRSTDNGNTWSDIRSIVDYSTGQSASDPSMILNENTGEIILFFNYMDLRNERDVYYLKIMKSKDHGKIWSTPRDITDQISKPEWKNDFKFITSGRGIYHSNGDLIHTLVNLEHGTHLFKSSDNGKMWQLIDSPIIPGDESKVIELADGSLMVNSRVNKSGSRYIHRSQDYGMTWTSTSDSQLIDPSCNASIIRYTSEKNGWDKNRLLFSNANAPDKRENMTIKISYDEGITWTSGKTIYPGSSAYSSMTILENGDIGLVFEKDNYQETVFVKVTLDYLTDGMDKASRVKND
ncbi:MAG: exo-alpha-sialidase [Saprospiraceae bacterium]|nr:exo-alpha-sialidase [Saprospiraceae bacterium]